MSKADIIDYLNKGLKRGYGLNTLKHTLLQHGHDPAIVEECASAVTSRPQPAHHGSPSFLKKKSPLPWVAFGIVIILIAGVAIAISSYISKTAPRSIVAIHNVIREDIRTMKNFLQRFLPR